jgi:hypothetical protein
MKKAGQEEEKDREDMRRWNDFVACVKLYIFSLGELKRLNLIYDALNETN